MPLRWFRFGKKEQEAAAQEAAAREEETPPEVVEAQPGPEAVESDGAPGTAKKKRRRGSRGGRGRKKPGSTTADVAADASAIQASSEEPTQGSDAERKSERKSGERKSGRPPADRKSQRATRRRTPTRRAPLPAAKRELLISVDVGEQRVAVLEDDRVAEVYLERPERRSIAGNIYLGVVDNVLPGMEAAFVEIGLEKNGFLYVDEIVGPELEGRKGARKIQDLIKRGQTVLVQAVKDPMKSKGARLTTELSLPGRFLVYVPYGEGMGVSRRLDDQERTRLKEIVRELDAKGGGIIVRTAAEGASAEDIERDLVFLQRLWKTIQAKAEGATAPELVYEEAELPLRIVRDLFAGDFVGAQIDDDRTHRRIVSYLKKTSPHMIERVHRYREKTPLFEASGVEQEIRSTLARRVDLPSGGYLVFDYAEAFTVIDVNTGRFVGSRGKSAGGRLEDTIVKNNLEAVKEVVRQLRLRDIGGIIVIDFIDMANPKNRSTVEDALRSELERDRTKTYVVEISPLGLVEMTRQNVTDGPREILTTKCVVCAGDGFVVSEATHALEIERRLREVAKGSRVQAFRIAVHPRVLALLAGPGRCSDPGGGGGCATPLFPRSCGSGQRSRPSRSLRGLDAGKARDAPARLPCRGGCVARAEARRSRALRPGGGRRQGGRLGGRRLGRSQAGRQEGVRHHRSCSRTVWRSHRSPTPRTRGLRSPSRPRRRSQRVRRAERRRPPRERAASPLLSKTKRHSRSSTPISSQSSRCPPTT